MTYKDRAFVFVDAVGVERVVRATSYVRAAEAAHAFVLKQTEGGVAAAQMAARSVREEARG